MEHEQRSDIMSILNLGTYPPKQCGIATFSADLCRNLTAHGNKIQVMAVSDENFNYCYPAEVVFNIRQNQKNDYIKAARFINNSPHIKLLIIQHEYGIYGGQDGALVLELINLLHKPYVVVTHTVLPRPSRSQKKVLFELCHRAAAVVCMTRRSAHLLGDLYEAPSELIHVIAHGVPEFPYRPQQELKQKYGLQYRQVISTFGLIGPGKGLELGIKAMKEVVDTYPDTLYLILGQTHPMLQRCEGESYRQMLEGLVAELNLTDHVGFVNKFLNDNELGDYLYLTDIYLSPYPNKDQAVSGTLSFAVGCGRAIVSTPYAYASEVLNQGRGLLTSTTQSEEIAVKIKSILADAELKTSLQSRALSLGREWSWPNIGQQYSNLFARLLDKKLTREESNLHYARL